jgi:hypothetical protein
MKRRMLNVPFRAGEVLRGSGWAYAVEHGAEQWKLCNWAEATEEKLLDTPKPSPDARTIRVAIGPLRPAPAIATPEWLPIDTAPTDGSHVLIVDAGVVNEGRHIEGHGWWLAHNDPSDSWGPGQLHPTHWMPLPEPPAQTVGACNAGPG